MSRNPQGRAEDLARGLKIALQYVMKTRGKTWESLVEMPKWRAAGLPTSPRTVRDWQERGIPLEGEGKNLKALQSFLKLSDIQVLSEPEETITRALDAGWTAARSPGLPPVPADIVDTLAEAAQRWKTEGLPYYLVTMVGDWAWRHAVHPEALQRSAVTRDDSLLAFMTLISIHFEAGWHQWVPRCAGNPMFIEVLLNTLREKYWRVRFRVLYALEFLCRPDGGDDREEVLRRVESRLAEYSEATQHVLQERLPKHEIVQYLSEVRDHNEDAGVRQKAAQVLNEIGTLWMDQRVCIKPAL